jgi:murein DD-endopeptidase MepM/ murein hydrolase activator NlpD
VFTLRSGQIRDAIDYVDRLRRGLTGLPLRRPVNEPDLSSPFGSRRDPFFGGWAHHSGLDFRGETGEPVHAAGAGTVEAAGRNGGYGLAVDIDHGNGLSTRYGHLSAILVREGQRVTAGQVIGRIGSTGRSTGPHLHWETRVNGDAVNPDRFMRVGQRLGVW